MTTIDLYDFEGNIPDMFAVGFIAAELNPLTTNIAPTTQKLRPRSELIFRPQGATSPPRLMMVQTKSANLIPANAQYNAVTGQAYEYDITSLLTAGRTYLYTPGTNEVSFGIIINLQVQPVAAGLFTYQTGQAVLFGSSGPVQGSGPFPPINVTASIVTQGPPHRCIAAYNGELEIDLITEPSAAGKSQHSAYRAEVRNLMELDTIRNAVNLTSSPYQIDFVSPSNSTDTMQTDKGYETSKLTYEVQFSIKQSAFDQLLTP